MKKESFINFYYGGGHRFCINNREIFTNTTDFTQALDDLNFVSELVERQKEKVQKLEESLENSKRKLTGLESCQGRLFALTETLEPTKTIYSTVDPRISVPDLPTEIALKYVEQGGWSLTPEKITVIDTTTTPETSSITQFLLAA